ncbi:putative serine/threonine-protein kinase [Carex littledalei]|uniref:Putative serine/threonine-protein kinase n=1 Tax=Carex littledalei TaxID=544730 RepID=A0A833V8M9_9POAL|nr:putative serine/threonine-protein kinase [Carex littledalei]
MAASVLACLFFMFFLLCFSNSCTPTLPCDPSIQIKPPFYLPSDITKDPNCQGNLLIECDDKKPFMLLWRSLSLSLESISYDPNIIVVQDPYLSSSLNKSGCGNLYFNFSTPVNDFHHEMHEQLKTSLSSVICDPLNPIQSPPNIFGTDYNLSYTPFLDEDDKHLPNCRRPDNSFASFGYMLSFEIDSGKLSLLSASYSGNLAAWPGCFVNSTEVFGKEPEGRTCDQQCKGKHLRTRIIIGCVVGFAFVLALCGLLLFFYKRKKLRLISSSSKILVQREVSNQYFHDSEMVGSEYTQIFSYEELQEATEGFSESKELGDGGFGIVYKGKYYHL